MSWLRTLRRSIPFWLALVAILVTASVTALLLWGPNLLNPKPDFQLQPNLSSQTLLVGCHHGGTSWLAGCTNGSISKISVKSINGFAGIVTLAAATPANVNATITGYNGNPVAILGPNDTVFLGVSAGVAGNLTVAITGTSGQLSHSVSVTIIAQDMTFQDSVDPLVVPQNSKANITVTMHSVNGVHGNLTVGGGPISPWIPLGKDEVLLYSPAANCSMCSGNPPPYPLLPGGTVQVIVIVTWQANDSGKTVGCGISVSVPGLNGDLGHTFTIVFG